MVSRIEITSCRKIYESFLLPLPLFPRNKSDHYSTKEKTNTLLALGAANTGSDAAVVLHNEHHVGECFPGADTFRCPYKGLGETGSFKPTVHRH